MMITALEAILLRSACLFVLLPLKISVDRESQRPDDPTHTSESVPIDVLPSPTSLQFRVLYTYAYSPICIRCTGSRARMYIRTLPVLPDEGPEGCRPAPPRSREFTVPNRHRDHSLNHSQMDRRGSKT
jgi:hypothetical protein